MRYHASILITLIDIVHTPYQYLGVTKIIAATSNIPLFVTI